MNFRTMDLEPAQRSVSHRLQTKQACVNIVRSPAMMGTAMAEALA